jgi:hypothetical protein
LADLPSSPTFIEFLYCDLMSEPFFVGSWHAQDEESLSLFEGRFENPKEKAAFVLSNPESRERILQSYRYFKDLVTGRRESIEAIQRYRFYFVLGIPRSGGTFLTKQLFRAAGMDYKKVPNALAHDGFPQLGAQGLLERAGRLGSGGLLQLAEYLTMVDMYFGKYASANRRGEGVVPKKLTRALHGFRLLHATFADKAHYIVTMRHPLAVIQSVLDKSGGMPAGKRFVLRSAIERWALEDWLKHGMTEDRVRSMSYVDVFLGYWKRYYFKLAMDAVPATSDTRLVVFGAAHMSQAARSFYEEFGSHLVPEPFKQAAAPVLDVHDRRKSEGAVREVASFWRQLGFEFPLKAVLEGS